MSSLVKRPLLLATLFVIWSFVSCAPAFAQIDVTDSFEEPTLSEQSVTSDVNLSVEPPRRRRVHEISIGGEGRLRREVGSNDRESFPSTRFGLGVRFDRWLYQAQYGELNSQSKAGILSTDYKSRELMFMASRLSLPEHWISGVIGGGLGVYRDEVTTKLSGASSRDDIGDVLFMGQVHAGGRVKYKRVFLQFQLNLIKQQTNPSLDYSGTTSLGIIL